MVTFRKSINVALQQQQTKRVEQSSSQPSDGIVQAVEMNGASCKNDLCI